MADVYKIGKKGEDLARVYLESLGYKVIDQNYKNNIGEIDLIAKDRSVYCFIEVKTRLSNKCGDGLEAVTLSKQKKIQRVAQKFIQDYNILDEYGRFDVVGIDMEKEPPRINLIKNAFGEF